MLEVAIAALALLQMPVIIPSHDHSAGPIPSRIAQTGEVTCAAGELAVTARWRRGHAGLALDRVRLNGREMPEAALQPVRAALRSATGLRNVEAACFTSDTFLVHIWAATGASGTDHISFLIKADGVRLLP